MIPEFIEAGTPFTRQELDEIAESVGRDLPKDYRDFVMKYGGAFVGGLVDGSLEFPILAFFRASSVLSSLDWHRDLKEANALPFADCELGNLWILDKNNKVHYINYYNKETKVHRVSCSFSEFLSRLTPEDD